MAMGLPPRFQELWRHCAALCDEEYWEVASLGNEQLEGQMRAAAFVLHGGMLQKFRKSGREKPHRRFVRVESGLPGLSGRQLKVMLHWDKKSGAIVRADDEVWDKCFQGEGGLVVCLSLLQLAITLQQATKIDVGIGVLGVQGQ